jgi:hypothetical protein
MGESIPARSNPTPIAAPPMTIDPMITATFTGLHHPWALLHTLSRALIEA